CWAPIPARRKFLPAEEPRFPEEPWIASQQSTCRQREDGHNLEGGRASGAKMYRLGMGIRRPVLIPIQTRAASRYRSRSSRSHSAESPADSKAFLAIAAVTGKYPSFTTSA